MVVHKHAHIVGVGNGAVRDTRPRPSPVHVETSSAERGVGKVAVVKGRLSLGWNLDAVLPQTGVVVGGVKLIIREKYRKDYNTPIPVRKVPLYTMSCMCNEYMLNCVVGGHQTDN